jgi:hypothetical protein
VKRGYRCFVCLSFYTLTLLPARAQQNAAPERSADGQFVAQGSAASGSQSSAPELTELKSFWPRSYAYGGFAPSEGAGYSTAAGTAGAGLDCETSRLIALTQFAVEDAHKLDSGTGAEAHFMTRLFVRAPASWYFGGGAQWNDLDTVLYSKHSWRPGFGAGKDFLREAFSARAQALYLLPGTDHLNGLQGPELSLWVPSPATHHHWFYRQVLGIYEFHQTSVPGNPGLNDRSVSAFLELTVMYRF